MNFNSKLKSIPKNVHHKGRLSIGRYFVTNVTNGDVLENKKCVLFLKYIEKNYSNYSQFIVRTKIFL